MLLFLPFRLVYHTPNFPVLFTVFLCLYFSLVSNACRCAYLGNNSSFTGLHQPLNRKCGRPGSSAHRFSADSVPVDKSHYLLTGLGSDNWRIAAQLNAVLGLGLPSHIPRSILWGWTLDWTLFFLPSTDTGAAAGNQWHRPGRLLGILRVRHLSIGKKGVDGLVNAQLEVNHRKEGLRWDQSSLDPCGLDTTGDVAKEWLSFDVGERPLGVGSRYLRGLSQRWESWLVLYTALQYTTQLYFKANYSHHLLFNSTIVRSSQSFKMPAPMEPTQQAPMTSDNGDIVTQQPVSV